MEHKYGSGAGRRQDCRVSRALLLRLPGPAPVFRRQRFLRVAMRRWRDGAQQTTQSEFAGRWGLTQARAVMQAGRNCTPIRADQTIRLLIERKHVVAREDV